MYIKCISKLFHICIKVISFHAPSIYVIIYLSGPNAKTPTESAAEAARDWGEIDTIVGVKRKLIKDVANV